MGNAVPNSGPFHVANSGGPVGWTLQWGKGADSLHLCPDAYLSTAAAEDLRLVSVQQGRTAWEAALPTAWGNWYAGLSTARRTDVWLGYLHHPPMA